MFADAVTSPEVVGPERESVQMIHGLEPEAGRQAPEAGRQIGSSGPLPTGPRGLPHSHLHQTRGPDWRVRAASDGDVIQPNRLRTGRPCVLRSTIV